MSAIEKMRQAIRRGDSELISDATRTWLAGITTDEEYIDHLHRENERETTENTGRNGDKH